MLLTDCATERVHSVTLVECVLTNERETPVAVRVDNQLSGPVWPPRRHGQPVAGWDENGYQGVVRGNARLPLGYATPASESNGSPPVAVHETACPGDGNASSTADTPSNEHGALGDPRPPATVVPNRPAIRNEHLSAATLSLDPVKRRIVACERIATAGGVPVMARQLDAIGGLDGLDRTMAGLEADREFLSRVRGRFELLDRIDRVLERIPRDELEAFA